MEKKKYVSRHKDYARTSRFESSSEDQRSPGPAHSRTVTLRNGQTLPIGVGRNTEEAKERAAKNAPRSVKEDANPGLVVVQFQPDHRADVQLQVVDSAGLTNVNAAQITGYNKTVKNPQEPVAYTEGSESPQEEQSALFLPEEGASALVQADTNLDLKLPSCTAVSDGSVPARMSTPPSTLKSLDAQSKSVATSSSDSVVFTNSSNLLIDQDVMSDGKMSAGSRLSETMSISRFLSDFVSIELLGKGAFGHVYKAKKKLTRKYFAIKIVSCNEIEKALREVKALSDLQHCNIVRYFTCWMEDSHCPISQWDSETDGSSTSQSSISDSSINYLYIQMELCDTKTLRDWIDEKNADSVNNSKRRDESLTIVKQIVSGVDYIHSKNFIHRDLKPANILFGPDKEIKIGDFGLVTPEKDDDTENLLERTADKGTPNYMAPEQETQKTYDRKVDIFSVGLIYFELLWKFSTAHERQQFMSKVPDLFKVWRDVRRQKFPQDFSDCFLQEHLIIKQILCENPEDRPEASELKTRLKESTRRNDMQQRGVHRGSRTH